MEHRQLDHRLAALREGEQVDGARFGAHGRPRRRQRRHNLPFKGGRHPPLPLGQQGEGNLARRRLEQRLRRMVGDVPHLQGRAEAAARRRVRLAAGAVDARALDAKGGGRIVARRARRPKAAEEATAGDELVLVVAAHRAAADERRGRRRAVDKRRIVEEGHAAEGLRREAAAARPGERAVVANVAGEDVDGRRVGGRGGKVRDARAGVGELNLGQNCFGHLEQVEAAAHRRRVAEASCPSHAPSPRSRRSRRRFASRNCRAAARRTARSPRRRRRAAALVGRVPLDDDIAQRRGGDHRVQSAAAPPRAVRPQRAAVEVSVDPKR